ncbi:MAG: CopG family transcriptional regulator [Candidatus Nitrosoglobus sp.]|jgi:predicted HicB family RNase H-like nuclease
MTRVLLNVRINPELRQQLKEIAKQQNRPLSNLVETVLMEFAKHEFIAKKQK